MVVVFLSHNFGGIFSCIILGQIRHAQVIEQIRNMQVRLINGHVLINGEEMLQVLGHFSFAADQLSQSVNVLGNKPAVCPQVALISELVYRCNIVRAYRPAIRCKKAALGAFFVHLVGIPELFVGQGNRLVFLIGCFVANHFRKLHRIISAVRFFQLAGDFTVTDRVVVRVYSHTLQRGA
ncbi:hypothetical protein D3C75_854870 [compost metagenome]